MGINKIHVCFWIIAILFIPLSGCKPNPAAKTDQERLDATIKSLEIITQQKAKNGMHEANIKMLSILNKINVSQLSKPIPSDATLFYNENKDNSLMVVRWIESRPTINTIVIQLNSIDGDIKTKKYSLEKNDYDVIDLYVDESVSYTFERQLFPDELKYLISYSKNKNILIEVVLVSANGMKTDPIPMSFKSIIN